MHTLLIVLTVAFSLFTAGVVWHLGPVGFFGQLLASPAAWQVLLDLTIALSLVLAWLWRDCQRHGRSFWPWLVLTLALGSIGPLLYLVRRGMGELSNKVTLAKG